MCADLCRDCKDKCRSKKFYCEGRDAVKVVYDDNINVAHSGNTITVSHVSITFTGRYGAMLSDLKDKNSMYYEVLERILKAGLDRGWFDLNARRNEI